MQYIFLAERNELMKRIVAIIVSLVILTGLINVSAAQSDTKASLEAYTAIDNLGIFEGVANEETVTRGTLARVLNNILTYASPNGASDSQKWKENFFGTSEEFAGKMDPDNIEVPKEYGHFNDVPANHTYFDAIEYVGSIGLMNGVGGGSFSPDTNITTDMVCKVFTLILGYGPVAEERGGYNSTAYSLGIFNGVDVSDGVYSIEDLAQVIYNCFDVSVLQIVNISSGGFEYKTLKDDTFLNSVLEIETVEGTVTDNGITSLRGESKTKEKDSLNSIIVDGTELFYTGWYDRTSILGREVVCYYTTDKNGVRIMRHMELAGNDKVVEISAEDIISVSKNEIRYYDDAERAKTIKLANSASVIFNNEALTSYSHAIFDITAGKICVIDSGDNGQIVTVVSIESWYTGAVDLANEVMYNASHDGKYASDDDILYLDDDRVVEIYDANGNIASIDKLVQGAVVDIVESSNYVAVYMTDSIVTDFIIDTVSTEQDITYISNGEMTYEVSAEYIDAYDYKEIKPGATATLYIGRDGKVIWMIQALPTDLQYGYLVATAPASKGLSESYQAKIFTTSGLMQIFDIDKKITVSDSEGKEFKVEDKKFFETYTNSGAFQSVIRYRKTADGLLGYVELPISDHNTELDKLHMVLAESQSLAYKSEHKNFGAKMYLGSNSKVLSYIEGETADEAYLWKTGGFINDQSYKINGYTSVAGSPIADIVLWPGSVVSNVLSSADRSMAIVKRVGSKINLTGDVMDSIDVYLIEQDKSMAETTLFVEEDVLSKVKDHTNNNELYIIEPGDIIRFRKNMSGNIEELRILWDESQDNPASEGGKSGNIAGTIGCYDPTLSTYYTNPLNVSNVNGGEDGGPFINGNNRIGYGYAVAKLNNLVCYTTQDLSTENYDPDGKEGIYKVEWWTVPTYMTTITIDKTNGAGKMTVTAKKGSAADIRTYEDYGSNCSRIIMSSWWGVPKHIIIIND